MVNFAAVAGLSNIRLLVKVEIYGLVEVIQGIGG